VAFFVHHEVPDDITLIVPSDSTKEVEDVFMVTHLGDCLCIQVSVGVGSFSCIAGCCCRPYAEIVILDFPIDLRCIVVDISAVL
jgi:hypothetical protein